MLELLVPTSFTLYSPQQMDDKAVDKSQIFCPICVANGYASGVKSDQDWFFAANSSGGALWYRGIDRVQLGAVYHQGSRGLRALAGYQILQESAGAPALNISYGVQSQETGSTGTSLTLEKNFFRGIESLNVFGGVSRRTGETQNRAVYGFKWSPDDRWFFGNQFDGVDHNPFFQVVRGDKSYGLLYTATRKVSLTFGISF
jgi:hypothetical protein